MEQKFDVTGMTCAACSARIGKALGKLDGVYSCDVNLLTNSMRVNFDPSVTDINKIIAAVEAEGYGASVAQGERAAVSDESRPLRTRFLISLIFLVPLMYLSMGHMLGLHPPLFLRGTRNAVIQLVLCLPVIYVNRKYFIVGFRTLFKGAPNMDSLIAVGSGAAVVYGIISIARSTGSTELYFESAVMILTLVTLGKYFEARSRGRTGEAISRLVALRPDTAQLLRDGKEVTVPLSEVKVGDLLVVRPGSRIPVDGVVVSGSSGVDESAVTGESIPVEKHQGDKLIAATMVKTGYFTMRAERVGDDTTLSQIIRLVEDAASSKAPIARLADKIAGIFVPIVIAIAVISAAAWAIAGAGAGFALNIAIAVLVISCPCALGLATPVAIMVGTGKGAEHGILVKSGEALETLHGIDCVVLDKTGTLTEGKPRVTDIVPLDSSEREVLGIAAALEKGSEHPLAEAILERAESEGVDIPDSSGFNAVPGRGVEAFVEDKHCLAGNLRFLSERGISAHGVSEVLDKLAAEGKTPMLIAAGEKLIGLIAVADTLKPGSAEAVRGFAELGIEVVMLTGDNRRTAGAIGKELGVNSVISEVLPADKEREIASLQEKGRKVAMVGDGINDAPALTRADVGIAIGAGTDVAIGSADVVLQRSDLRDAVTAVRLSRAVVRNIKQNLFWAFFYNCLGIPLAAGAFYAIFGILLSPMFAAAAMSLSSVFVVSNALRLRRFKPYFKPGEKNRGQDENTENIGEVNKLVTIKISGMSCAHCSSRVEKALNSLPGVKASVDLDSGTAKVEGGADIEAMKKAVEDAGYTVTAVE